MAEFNYQFSDDMLRLLKCLSRTETRVLLTLIEACEEGTCMASLTQKEVADASGIHLSGIGRVYTMLRARAVIVTPKYGKMYINPSLVIKGSKFKYKGLMEKFSFIWAEFHGSESAKLGTEIQKEIASRLRVGGPSEEYTDFTDDGVVEKEY